LERSLVKTLFSTDPFDPHLRYARWRETLMGHGVPLEQVRLDERPFHAKLEVANVGPLLLTRVSHGALRSEATPDLIRRNGKEGTVVVIFKLAGLSRRSQDDRSSVQRVGDFVVLDHRPAAHESSDGSQTLFLELPREPMEAALGPSRLYTSLTVGRDLASTALTTQFFHDLIRVRHDLDAHAGARMAQIGTDLIVASIAERLAKEVPRTLQGTLVIQRAKAHVEANLCDPTLDPPQLAAAVGVSLRRLQELFHERGQHISDWIWHRRLDVASLRLSSPACAHLSIGMVAYEHGFTSQAHFSRRFKDRYGMSPREYRDAARAARPEPLLAAASRPVP
jgi:AraC family transcriptional regulator, positive regulator of tynA and feaB